MSRRRVVLDSNVLISAILFGGTPGRVLNLVITGAVRCGISPPILDEVREVLLEGGDLWTGLLEGIVSAVDTWQCANWVADE